MTRWFCCDEKNVVVAKHLYALLRLRSLDFEFQSEKKSRSVRVSTFCTHFEYPLLRCSLEFFFYFPFLFVYLFFSLSISTEQIRNIYAQWNISLLNGFRMEICIEQRTKDNKEGVVSWSQFKVCVWCISLAMCVAVAAIW